MTVRLLAAAFAICCAPLAARADDDDNPVKNAKVGDYATYKLSMKILGQSISGSSTQSVTAKTDKEATVKTTGSFDLGGQKTDIAEQEEKIDLTKPFDPTKIGNFPPGVMVKFEKLKEGKEKVKANGKEYDCTWTTYNLKGKANGQEFTGSVKAWTSKELPLGMVKVELTADLAKMEMTMELAETGNKK
jgi:hypothetical protein